jgi:hypothetical protein
MKPFSLPNDTVPLLNAEQHQAAHGRHTLKRDGASIIEGVEGFNITGILLSSAI